MSTRIARAAVRSPSIPSQWALIDQPPTPLQACMDSIATTTFYALIDSQSIRRYGGSASTITLVCFGITPSYGRTIRSQTSSSGNDLQPVRQCTIAPCILVGGAPQYFCGWGQHQI